MKPLIKKSLKKWLVLIFIGFLAYLLGYLGAQLQNVYHKVGSVHPGQIERTYL
jgi:hypothetical protein